LSKIDFLHLGVPFSGETLRSQAMGGTESSIVQLAEALARRGHDVQVFNGVAAPRHEFGVHWWPFQSASKHSCGEIGIAVANPKLFSGLSYSSPIFWLHNPLKGWRQIRRGNVGPLMRTRPLFVLLGDYHKAHVPRWLPSSGWTVIHHGVHAEFFRDAPAAEPPAPRAIFTSQPYRGLDWLLEIWSDIKRQVPAATLDVLAPKPHQAEANSKRAALDGVAFRGSISRPQLALELSRARVQLIPGHRDETYCLAAAEATAAGVPIVTLGRGSLAERVHHGATGFIAPGKGAFIEHTAALLTNDPLWSAMHRACLADAALTGWDARAEEWEQLFASLSRPGLDKKAS
jgi:glycosyltransferase involved in cell wall biosynthesis